MAAGGLSHLLISDVTSMILQGATAPADPLSERFLVDADLSPNANGGQQARADERVRD